MQVAPACTGSEEGSDHFGSHVHSLSLHFYKRLFPRLESMTSWSQGNNFTTTAQLNDTEIVKAWVCIHQSSWKDMRNIILEQQKQNFPHISEICNRNTGFPQQEAQIWLKVTNEHDRKGETEYYQLFLAQLHHKDQ
jgi:hypothetical protein